MLHWNGKQDRGGWWWWHWCYSLFLLKVMLWELSQGWLITHSMLLASGACLFCGFVLLISFGSLDGGLAKGSGLFLSLVHLSIHLDPYWSLARLTRWEKKHAISLSSSWSYLMHVLLLIRAMVARAISAERARLSQPWNDRYGFSLTPLLSKS